ncbi:unnamed protein product [Protopolystoma xenopodis]|uniref:Uncharacterized protein n=1 Tax=Protopolystoma xenopodis TaxID=117903 RepID=A0A3S5AP82_9PLAT|nr:unnamed protein product [Protopolystoma xenopodis]
MGDPLTPAILLCIRSMAAPLGFFMASHTSVLHESLLIDLADFATGQADPRWVGAWWLGWLPLSGFTARLSLE